MNSLQRFSTQAGSLFPYGRKRWFFTPYGQGNCLLFKVVHPLYLRRLQQLRLFWEPCFPSNT